jgi:hypothetical protein
MNDQRLSQPIYSALFRAPSLNSATRPICPNNKQNRQAMREIRSNMQICGYIDSASSIRRPCGTVSCYFA